MMLAKIPRLPPAARRPPVVCTARAAGDNPPSGLVSAKSKLYRSPTLPEHNSARPRGRLQNGITMSVSRNPAPIARIHKTTHS